jgi:hypothetical protein
MTGGTIKVITHLSYSKAPIIYSNQTSCSRVSHVRNVYSHTYTFVLFYCWQNSCFELDLTVNQFLGDLTYFQTRLSIFYFCTDSSDLTYLQGEAVCLLFLWRLWWLDLPSGRGCPSAISVETLVTWPTFTARLSLCYFSTDSGDLTYLHGEAVCLLFLWRLWWLDLPSGWGCPSGISVQTLVTWPTFTARLPSAISVQTLVTWPTFRARLSVWYFCRNFWYLSFHICLSIPRFGNETSNSWNVHNPCTSICWVLKLNVYKTCI